MPNRTNHAIVIVVAVIVIVSGIATIIVQRGLLFDDSFITYRYAKNLANGHGITWNPGEEPVEGYTNFLLVIALAPVIKADLDPLLATRIWSVMAACGLAVLLGRMAMKHHQANGVIAALVGLAFLPAGNTWLLCTVGLETVIFTFFLFLSFSYGVSVLQTGRASHALGFGASQLLAFLLRPESAVIGLLVLWMLIRDRKRFHGRFLTICTALAVSLFLPLIAYLGWKLIHFGHLIPNPFFIKADHGKWLSGQGLASVIEFLTTERVVLALATFSLLSPARDKIPRTLALLFTAVMCAFYARVDTLADIYGRFLYPVSPFLFYLAIPTICKLFRQALNWKARPLTRVAASTIVFCAVFYVQPYDTILAMKQALRWEDRHDDPSSLVPREYAMAQALKRFDHIKEISIAWGDAGVIPYFTEAKVIDYVGLNDKFIARTKQLDALVDYFFNRRPTMIIHSTKPNLTWIRRGHGILPPNLWKWSKDSRWDQYSYVGTCKTRTKLLHMHIRTDYEHFNALRSHIKDSVADTVYDAFPLPMGTRREGES